MGFEKALGAVKVIKDQIQYRSQRLLNLARGYFQAIPGNDQNASPTNQKTAGSKLDRTSQLMFYGSWRHLESFSRGFLV